MRGGRRSWKANFVGAAGLAVVLLGIGCGGGAPVAPPPSQPAAKPAAPAPAVPAAAPQPAAPAAPKPVVPAPPAAEPKAPSKAAAAQYALAPEEGMPQYGGGFRRAETPAKALTFLDNVPVAIPTLVASSYNKLVEWKFEGGTHLFSKLEPSLAKSWEVSGDGLTWTFKLREGVKFHDGTPFTSADVKATLDFFLNPGKAGPPGRSYIAPFATAVEAPDPMTVVIKLKNPTAVLVDNLGVVWMLMASKKDLERGPEWFQTNVNGTGPFIFNKEKWQREISYQLDRNPSYWQEGLPYLDSLVVFGISDRAAQTAAFETRKIDVLKNPTPGQVQQLLQRHGRSVRALPMPGYGFHYMIYNARKPPFDNVKVRQALNLWMDRKQIVDKVDQGEGFLGSWIEPTTFPGFGVPYNQLSKTELALRPDKAEARRRAKELLAEAGYADLGKTKLRMAADSSSPERLTCSQVAAAQLRDLGFDVSVEPKESLAYTQALGKGDYDATCYSGGVSYIAPEAIFQRYLSSKGQRNYSGLVDQTLDKLLAEADQAVNPESRKRSIAEVERYLLTGQNAMHALYYTQRTVLQWEWVRGRRHNQAWQEEMNIYTWVTGDAPGRK